MRKLAIIAAFAALAGGGALVAPSLVSQAVVTSQPGSQSSERDAQCRQDGQEDVTSIQLNILFNCYGADQGEGEGEGGDWSGDTALCTTDDECEHLFPELRGRVEP